MAEEFLSRAEFGQFVARMDKRFDHVQQGMAELRSEMRSQRVLMLSLLVPLVVSLALAIVGVTAKLAFFM